MFGFSKWKEKRLAVERHACGFIAQYGKSAVQRVQEWYQEGVIMLMPEDQLIHARKVAVRVKQLVELGDA